MESVVLGYFAVMWTECNKRYLIPDINLLRPFGSSSLVDLASEIYCEIQSFEVSSIACRLCEVYVLRSDLSLHIVSASEYNEALAQFWKEMKKQ